MFYGIDNINAMFKRRKTILICINKALDFLEKNKIKGEVLIADNGSKDQSKDIIKKQKQD